MSVDFTIRPFALEEDYAAMARVMNEVAASVGSTAGWTVESIKNMDAFTAKFDPKRDRIIAEGDGRMIAVGRVEAVKNTAGERVYFHSFNIAPDWRGKGIEREFLLRQQNRLREIAKEHTNDEPRFFQTYSVHQDNAPLIATLEEDGYTPIRHSFEMLRPNLANVPDRKLPEAIEIRPIREEDLRKIYDANQEAFADHWGFVPWEEQAFEAWKNNEEWDRPMSRIAWSGDEVVGMVLIFIPHEHNRKYPKKRAFTEAICVRRPWRNMGVASALIARCLHALRDAGFDEAALSVDTQNLSGALRIYENMGYQVQRRYTTFRRAMD
jgi:mycothiol synthase